MYITISKYKNIIHIGTSLKSIFKSIRKCASSVLLPHINRNTILAKFI